MVGYVVGILVLLLGFLKKDPLYINLSLLILLVAFLWIRFSSDNIIEKVNPLILFCIGKSAATLGNILGIYYQNDNFERGKYWFYANELYLFDAALINWFGSVALLLGYFIYFKKYNYSVFPSLKYTISSEWLKKYDKILWTLFILAGLRILPLPISEKFLNLILSLFVFLYGYLSQKEENGQFYFFRGYVLVFMLTIYGYLFSFLRIDMVNPSILFFTGLFWGNGSVKVFKNVYLYPMFIFMTLFALSFNDLGGENRLNVESKNEILYHNLLSFVTGDEYDADNRIDEFSEERETSILGRMSNFNQLTKVVEVEREDGFYNGETLSYLAYAWIPRVLWPDKPIIAVGRWFALKAGLAYMYDTGEINNSVDMTPAGELYLNFGYNGVIIGCFLLGIFWAIIWNAANFFTELNITGIGFGAYLLNLGYWQLGADMQIVITVLSVYTVILLTDKLLNFIKTA